MRLLCSRCGKVFNLANAVKQFERLQNQIDPSISYFDDPNYEIRCGKCMFEHLQEIGGAYDSDKPIDEDDDDESYDGVFYIGYDDISEVPECCVACGNGAYPECKSGCPIFDD